MTLGFSLTATLGSPGMISTPGFMCVSIARVRTCEVLNSPGVNKLFNIYRRKGIAVPRFTTTYLNRWPNFSRLSKFEESWCSLPISFVPIEIQCRIYEAV